MEHDKVPLRKKKIKITMKLTLLNLFCKIFIYLFWLGQVLVVECVIFNGSIQDLVPDQGSNLGPMHWELKSQLLDHRSPPIFISFQLFPYILITLLLKCDFTDYKNVTAVLHTWLKNYTEVIKDMFQLLEIISNCLFGENWCCQNPEVLNFWGLVYEYHISSSAFQY